MSKWDADPWECKARKRDSFIEGDERKKCVSLRRRRIQMDVK